MTLRDSGDKTISVAAHLTQYSKQHQLWGTKTSWGKSTREEEALALSQVNQLAERSQHQSGGHWWSGRCADRRRPQEVPRQSLLPNRGNGCRGKVWSRGRSARKCCGKWKQARTASSWEQHMMCFHHQRTSISGMVRIQHVPFAQLQLPWNTSWQAARPASHKGDTPGGIIRY